MIGFPPGTEHAVTGGILFAEDFDLPDGYAHVLAPEEAAEPEVITPSYSAEELEAAREEARAAGDRAGREAARQADTARASDALAEIARALDGAREAAAAAAHDMAEDIARLLLSTFAAVVPSLCAQHGEAEIAAVLAQVLPTLHTEPRITVRVGDAVADAVRTWLATLDRDMQARIELLTTGLPPGDVQIAWRDGEAVRDTAAIWCGIAEILTPLGLLASPPADGADAPTAPPPTASGQKPNAHATSGHATSGHIASGQTASGHTTITEAKNAE